MKTRSTIIALLMSGKINVEDLDIRFPASRNIPGEKQTEASVKALKALLFEDRRMEREAILSLDRESIRFLAPLYRKEILRLFLKWLEGEAYDA